ncbi:MAG TPA: phosphoribosylanthranilate isomerase [Bacteroidales bacterium]|nr:phosphoribosylanthranilate isomerase [Bacteroidales bacterium]
MIRIKVCGMKDPLNVKEIAQANLHYLGFIFFPGSPRYVGADPNKALFENIPSGIQGIGVFVNEDTNKVINIAQHTDLEMIQLHGGESPDYCQKLRSAGLVIIKAFNVTEDFNFESIRLFMPGCDYFLFDTKSKKYGGSSKKFNWDKLLEYNLDKPFFLSGGIGPEDSAILKNVTNRGFFAIDINSRFEISPGQKDVRLINTFCNEVKKLNYEI